MKPNDPRGFTRPQMIREIEKLRRKIKFLECGIGYRENIIEEYRQLQVQDEKIRVEEEIQKHNIEYQLNNIR